MTEIILNDECVHCKDKECHDGYNFCNQAMKDNSFYKNAKLYKGLEVIKRPTYKELKKENAELKAQLESERDLPAIAYIQGAEKQKKKDEEELKKWKDEWQEQVQKATDEGYARTLQTMKLNKAKEIIKKFSEFANNEVEYDPEHPQEHTDLWNELCEEAEQFLSEVEK